MHRLIIAISLGILSCAAFGQPAAAEQTWVRQSNVYTNMLLDVQLAHAPEQGSQQGVAKFDRAHYRSDARR